MKRREEPPEVGEIILLYKLRQGGLFYKVKRDERRAAGALAEKGIVVLKKPRGLPKRWEMYLRYDRGVKVFNEIVGYHYKTDGSPEEILSGEYIDW
jgi:hypothetical protein